MEDQTGLLERAVAATAKVVGGVRSDQYEAPTPCPDWDVRGLLNHIVAGNKYFAARARGDQADMSVWGEDHLAHAEPNEAYDASARAALDAFRAPGGTDRAAALPSGGQGPKIFDMYLMEVFMHGRDLAVATGQDRSLDPEVAQKLYDQWAGRMPAEARGSVFGPEVECPADAPAGDRLAAYLGRNPSSAVRVGRRLIASPVTTHSPSRLRRRPREPS
jgi:uncharacterized protein (TIGR03086 family)